MENNISVGLDIGSTKTVILIGRKNKFNKIEILGIGESNSYGVNKGVVNNITQTINSIISAVKKAEKNAILKIDNVIVGISGNHINTIQHKDYIMRLNFEEVINKNDIELLLNQVYKLITPSEKGIIHVLPQEYTVDNQTEILEPIGMYGKRLEANFHVILGQISSIKNIIKCVNLSGLNLKSIIVNPIASSEAVLSDEEKEAGVVLIDIGGGTTNIIIIKDNIIRNVSVIPMGGNSITDNIKIECSIIDKQAELLKKKFGSTWPDFNKENEIVNIPGFKGREIKEISLKKLSFIIYKKMNEIFKYSYIEIENYRKKYPNKHLIAGIVITGGVANLKNIIEFIKHNTSMNVRIGYPDNLIYDKEKHLNFPEYSTVVGLLIYGINNKYKLINTNKNIFNLIKYNNIKFIKNKIENNKNKIKNFIEEFLEKIRKFLNNTN